MHLFMSRYKKENCRNTSCLLWFPRCASPSLPWLLLSPTRLSLSPSSICSISPISVYLKIYKRIINLNMSKMCRNNRPERNQSTLKKDQKCRNKSKQVKPYTLNGILINPYTLNRIKAKSYTLNGIQVNPYTLNRI